MMPVIARVNTLIEENRYEDAFDLLLSHSNEIHPLILSQKLSELNRSIRQPTLGLTASPNILPENKPIISKCWIDISDLVNYVLAGSRTVTGIQRLVLAFLKEFTSIERANCRLITFHDFERAGAIQIEWHFVDVLIAFISGILTIEQFQCKLEDFDRTFARQCSGVSNKDTLDTLLILGACWIVPGYPRSHASFVKTNNLKVASVIYDLIPYSHPEFVSGDAALEFYNYYIALLSISDILIPISNHVAQEINSSLPHFSQYIPRIPALFPNPLASQIAFQDVKALPHERGENISAHFPGLQINNFVICVGSVEVRKNHIGLFVAWRHLYSTLGDKCPQLVVVGKHGWKAEPFFHALENSNYLDGKIVVVSGVGDEDLAKLYANCLFSVYPSLDEGWGLPIGESLHAGKVCITSRVASMPEVGKDLALYVDPRDPFDIVKVCLKMILDPSLRSDLEDKIRLAKPLRSWSNYKDDFASIIDSAFNKQSAAPSASSLFSNIYYLEGLPHSFYWHLGYRMSDYSMGLAERHRSIDSIALGRVSTWESDFLAQELDGAWVTSSYFKASFFFKSSISQLSLRSRRNSNLILNITIHYFSYLSISSPIDTADVRLYIGRPYWSGTYDNDSPEYLFSDLLACDLTNIAKTNFDCMSFVFELPFNNEIAYSSDQLIIPCSFTLAWEPLSKYKIKINDSMVYNLKIKELSTTLSLPSG